MTDKDRPLLDLLDDVDARDRRQTEPITVEVAPRRWPIAVAAAAAALLIAANVLAPATGVDDSATTTTVDAIPRPSIAPAPTTTSPTTTLAPVTADDLLPPPGAVLSSPETGELVAAVSKIHDGAWFLYADGRLISIDDSRVGHPGWIEQRLIPAGVERVRSEFLASGLFDLSQQPTDPPAAVEEVFTALRVRDGGRLLVARAGTEPSQSDLSPCGIQNARSTRCHLIQYLRHLTPSLPQEDWVVQQFTRYVPSRFTACFTRREPTGDVAIVDLPSVLSVLPSPVYELLSGREPTRDPFVAAASCFDLTIAETRVLTASLIDAFGTPWYGSKGFGFATGVPVQLASTSVDLGIDVVPLLPAGGMAVWGG